jgi:hypothetical protein
MCGPKYILRNQAVTFLMYPEQLKQIRLLIKILIIVGHYVSDVLILRNQAGLAVTFLMYPEQLKQVRFIIKILIIVGHYVSDVFDIKKSSWL